MEPSGHETSRHPARPHAQRRPSRLAVAAAMLIGALAALPCYAQRGGVKEPSAAYESLFGAEEKRVAASGSTKDDAKFAASLLEKAKSLADDPTLTAVLHEKAYDFGIKDPDGYATAAAALKLMAGDSALAKEQLRPKQIELLKLQMKKGTPDQKAAAANAVIDETLAEAAKQAGAKRYADAVKAYKEAASLATSNRSPRADQINQMVKDAQARQLAMDNIQKLGAKADAGDAAAGREALDLALLELDDPAYALKFVRFAATPAHGDMLKKAASETPSTDPADLLALAAWYKALVATPRLSTNAKGTALSHAQANYLAFLDGYDKQDASRLEATNALADVTKQLAAYDGSPVTADKIVLWNTHNADRNNAGATLVNVVLTLRGTPAWRKDGIPFRWEANQDPPLAIPCPRTAFDSVRIEIVRWPGAHAGLSEVQVMRGAENLIEKSTIKASATFDPIVPVTALVDGITTSSTLHKGYWMAPVKQPAWVEFGLATSASKVAKSTK